MPSSLAVTNLAENDSPAARGMSLDRRLFLVLGFIALVYAFLAGLRTVQDFDLGWQLATARWVVQHHHVPSVDVLSYTMQGQPWIYPVGAGVVFYAAFLLGGYGLISWIGAAACIGSVALLLRRNSAAGAAIAILAVPLIAARTTPRADMFTVVLFAAFLSLLWENYQHGGARLWLLPLLMVAWVNVHFGFAAGLGLVLAYVAAELLETVFGADRRRAAIQRLRHAAGWLVCTVLATLINPWGWGIYRAVMLQQRANALQQLWINEWAPVPVNWVAIGSSSWLRKPGGAIYPLLAIAIVVASLALLRRHWAPAILLLGATYPAVRAVRMGALFACVLVVIGGPELSAALAALGRRIQPARMRWLLAAAAVVSLAGLAATRCIDLVSNRHYLSAGDEATFGTGLCSWFPRRAVDFIERAKLPGEVFNTYAAGGYLAWTLGPERPVYIDGRDTLYGPPRLARHSQLLVSPPDSVNWQDEASRYNINTVIIALARPDGIRPTLVGDFCNSTMWRPVYLDEISAVFVRRSPLTEELIEHFPLDCATAPLPAPSRAGKRKDVFDTWANAAITLAGLGRNSEALTAFQKALSIFPDSASLRRSYGDLLFTMGRLDESEQEYLAAVALDPSAATWGALAQSYRKRGRLPAAADAMQHEVQFSPRPYLPLLDLGYFYLDIGQPQNALKAFDDAARSTPRSLKAADNGFFDFKVAQGRSGAWDALGNLERATAYQEEAARLEPNVPQPWRRLARFYQEQGRLEDAKSAKEHAAALEGKGGQ